MSFETTSRNELLEQVAKLQVENSELVAQVNQLGKEITELEKELLNSIPDEESKESKEGFYKGDDWETTKWNYICECGAKAYCSFIGKYECSNKDCKVDC